MYNHLELNTLLHRIESGDIQVAYNVNLNLQVLMLGIENDQETESSFYVFFIQNNDIVKYSVVGLTTKIGYYSAGDIAMQYPHLPAELKLIN
jgi:hypothetical protein